MPAVSHGYLLLSADFQENIFNSFTVLIPTEKHFRKSLLLQISCRSLDRL